jgi:hypothetical protein
MGAEYRWGKRYGLDRKKMKEEVTRQLSDIQSRPKATAIQVQRGEFARPWIRRFRIVSERIFQDYWRSPINVYSKIALCAGVVVSSTFHSVLHFLVLIG